MPKYSTNFGAVSVRDTAFGAKGDGVTDDTAAIQLALTTVGSAGGGVVVAPHGTYLINPFISIPANVTLCGAGRGVTTFQRKVTGVQGNLFTVRLAGNHAGLRDCSVKGRWNPADPTTLTYDINVSIYGDSVEYGVVEGVESYNAHIGFLVGGIIGASESFKAQNHNKFVRCEAHDTYDLGFGLVAYDRTDAGTCIGCQVLTCTQHDSYATAGMEIRFQRAAQVVGFNARNNTNANLGAGLRLEETNNAVVTNLQTTNCYMGLQHVHDSYENVVTGWTSREDHYGVYSRQASTLQCTGFVIQNSTLSSIFLTYLDAQAWVRNNENLLFADGLITGAGNGAGFRYGIYVLGQGFTDAASADQGLGLMVRNVRITGSSGNGMLIEAGGNFSILGCVLDDNGTGSGVGIVVNPPQPSGTPDPTKPAGGYIDDCMFITTGNQTVMVGDGTGSANARNTALGSLVNIGAQGFGTTPKPAVVVGEAVPPILATGASHTVDDVIAVLQGLVLCKQS